MSTRAQLLTLLAAISLTATIFLIAIATAQPLITLPEGKDSVNQTRSIHITLADQAPERESNIAAQPIDEPVPKLETKQQPDPVSKKPEPEPEPKPKPKPKSVPVSAEKTSKPVAKTSTKPVGKAKPAESKQKQLRSGASPQTDSYLARLVRHLGAYRDYPRRARRLGLQGTPVVVFEFDREGRLLNYHLLKGSSHRILDDAALTMLKQASPFPTVPDEMTNETFRFQLPIAFQLR